jgi:hypothetical protein
MIFIIIILLCKIKKLYKVLQIFDKNKLKVDQSKYSINLYN